jgi:hypothetical protein
MIHVCLLSSYCQSARATQLLTGEPGFELGSVLLQSQERSSAFLHLIQPCVLRFPLQPWPQKTALPKLRPEAASRRPDESHYSSLLASVCDIQHLANDMTGSFLYV